MRIHGFVTLAAFALVGPQACSTHTKQLASLGATDVSVQREFQQGEHFFRHLALDSALAHYRRAVALDSTFAPALRGIYLTLWWQGRQDSVWVTYAFRAAAHNQNLAPRESVLVAIDSLTAAIYGAYWEKASGTDVWNAGRRLHRVLEEATRRFPADPEFWYELGEARWHFGFGPGASITLRDIVDAMDHAIGLDSEFAPALIGHSVESSLRAQDVAAARRYVRTYLTFGREADFFPVAAYIEHQLEADRAASPHGDSLLAAMSGEQLANTWFELSAWPDTAEVGVAVARRLMEPRVVASFWGGDSSIATMPFANALGYRGHLREALRVRGQRPWLLVEAALLGIVRSDSAASEFARWLRDGPSCFGLDCTPLALPWWTWRKDTLSLLAFLRRADEIERSVAGLGKAELWKHHNPWLDWRYSAAAGRGYLALARGDSSDALNVFLALPDSLCPGCDDQRLVTAQLLEARGREREAASMLDREIGHGGGPSLSEPFWALERARVNERLGNHQKALAGYSFVAAVWIHADPELQPYVAEAKAGLKRLGAELP